MRNDIKLVISDLDDTLLNDFKEISAENKRAARLLKEAGIHFTFATGRMEPMTREYVRQLELEVPVVAYNGALVRDPVCGEVIYEHNLEPSVAGDVMDYCRNNQLDFIAYTETEAYYPVYSKRVQAFRTYNELAKRGGSELVKLFLVEELLDEDMHPKFPVIKFFVQSEDQDALNALEQMIARYESLSCVCSLENSLDIMGAGISKGYALRRLCDYYNIPLSQVAAFGDQDNDAEMLAEAGLSFSMLKGSDKCKAAAQKIGPDNNCDAFARMVHQFIL